MKSLLKLLNVARSNGYEDHIIKIAKIHSIVLVRSSINRSETDSGEYVSFHKEITFLDDVDTEEITRKYIHAVRIEDFVQFLKTGETIHSDIESGVLAPYVIDYIYDQSIDKILMRITFTRLMQIGDTYRRVRYTLTESMALILSNEWYLQSVQFPVKSCSELILYIYN